MKVIGILDSASAKARTDELDAFRAGLKEAKCGVEGKEFVIKHSAAENDYRRLEGLAKQLVEDPNLKVLVAAGGPVSADWARKATTKTPIVFTTIDDPRKRGFLQNLEKPDGNLTGTWGLTVELDPARLLLLDQIVRTGKIGVLLNPNRNGAEQEKAVRAAADKIHRELDVQKAGSASEIDNAFKAFKGNVGALLVAADALFNDQREQVVKRAAENKIPAMYQWRRFVTVGGLMSFGPSIKKAYHQAGLYAGRLLKDEKTKIEDLPVVQATELELVINRRTADDLKLNLPPNLLVPVFVDVPAFTGEFVRTISTRA